MEDIRQAIERAKITQPPASTRAPDPRQLRANQVLGVILALPSRPRREEVELDLTRLEINRIFAYDGKDYRSRSFDMLRTGILRSMDGKGWTTLAITSPTPSCGKTFTAVNLALSMSRQRDRQVLLADLDLRRPHVSNYLGNVKCEEGSGIVDVVEGHIELQSAIRSVGKSRRQSIRYLAYDPSIEPSGYGWVIWHESSIGPNQTALAVSNCDYRLAPASDWP